MKNYYEILEVDKNASDEIIKVAYKSLVKKNHPDLKSGEEKQIAEQQIKEINEAYDVLCDPFQRHEYDQTLVENKVSIEKYNYVLNENFKLKQKLARFEEFYSRQNSEDNKYSRQNNYNRQYTQNQPSNYQDNYKKEGLFKNLSESMKTVIAIMLTFLIIFIILKIPFINSLLTDYYNNSMILILVLVLIGYIVFFRGKK